MKILRFVGKAFTFILTSAAKTLGGMNGAQTHGLENQRDLYKKREDYRP